MAIGNNADVSISLWKSKQNNINWNIDDGKKNWTLSAIVSDSLSQLSMMLHFSLSEYSFLKWSANWVEEQKTGVTIDWR